jgi:hypothetical protein
MEIILANNKGIVLVDEQDYEFLSKYSWHIHVAGTKAYARAWINGRREYMHRLLCNGDLVDHVNQNGLDNRRNNLREATKSLNTINSKIRSDNKTGYRGVVLNKKTGKYQAEYKLDGSRHYLGLFETPELANEAIQQHKNV